MPPQKFINIKTLNLEQLGKWMEGHSQPKYRAAQVWKWLYQKMAVSFEEMTDLGKGLRQKLSATLFIPRLKLIKTLTSKDKDTVKFLFALPDNELIESVLMRYKTKEDDRLSVCLSTQVGCPIACQFCASGVTGFKRNLETWEIIDQFLEIQRITPERIGNIVYMGMGEPLLNYKPTLESIYFFHREDTFGIGMRHITISTSGLADKIHKLAGEHLPVHLAVSLHASNNKTRTKLMPINKKFPIEELLSACKYYYKLTRRRITFEYVLIAGINDSPEQARELLKILSDIYCLVNLIPLNIVKEFPYAPPKPARVREFQQIIENGGIKVTLRAEKGDEMEAACGQLRRHSLKDIELTTRTRNLQ